MVVCKAMEGDKGGWYYSGQYLLCCVGRRIGDGLGLYVW